VCRILTLGLRSRISLCTAKEPRREHFFPLTINYEARE
jgi:polyribonucleotide nucleotidyltransferase